MRGGQVVDLIKRVSGGSLQLTVERGELVVPNIADCFPAAIDPALMAAMSEEERRRYWQLAMDQGLGSRLGAKHFTTVGKMKVGRVTTDHCVSDCLILILVCIFYLCVCPSSLHTME